MNAPIRNVLRLEPELTIYSAARVRSTLIEALAVNPSLTLELDDVCEFDSAGVQLLIAAARDAAARGAQLELRGHSSVVAEAFILLGLDAACPLTQAADNRRPA